jgi:hypothetical protein
VVVSDARGHEFVLHVGVPEACGRVVRTGKTCLALGVEGAVLGHHLSVTIFSFVL